MPEAREQKLGLQKIKLLCLIVLSSTFFVQLPTSAQVLNGLRQKKIEHKNDVVYLDNGDQITGEIEKVEFGVLFLKSDRATDTLQLDWKKVTAIQSSARYEFEIRNKERFIAIIRENQVNQIPLGEIELQLEDGQIIRTKIHDILGVHEMQRAILGRLDVSVDAGVSFTQGNKQTQVNIQSSLSFAKPKYSLKLSGSSFFSGTSRETDTSRHELMIGAERVLTPKWNAFSLGSFLHDNQQDLDLRTTLAIGLMRMIVKSNRTLFSASGGFAYTIENYFPEAQSDRKNAEALAGLNYTTYRFKGSELSATLQIFPSLSNSGRIRIDSYAYWKWEIVNDFYWKVSLVNNYDNRPPQLGTRNNLSVTSSVGLSF